MLFNVYDKMPVWLQNVAVTMAGVKTNRLKESRTFWKALSFLEASDKWSPTELRNYQEEKLRELTRHAYENVPYYRRVFDERRIHPNDIRTIEDLEKLPVLTKLEVRRQSNELQARGWPARRIVTGHTGGTTGMALQLAEDRDTWAWNWAVIWRFRKRFGIELGEPYITFGGRRGIVPLSRLAPPFWRRNLASRQTYVSVHHMTVQNMKPLVDYLGSRSVAFYAGYPSAFYLLASYLLRENIRLDRPPRVIITNSESLLPHQRRTIARAFDCEVADYYGQTEHCSLICECERHRYHVDGEFGIVEFLAPNRHATAARRIVSTGLQNPVMPLIRFDTGDQATLADEPCSCHRRTPTATHIDGRIEAVIVTPDGRQLGRLDQPLQGR